MTYIIVLVSLLVVLAGIISYTGDVLGTVVGKRRLSLFGARPKRSGQIIGVLAGILIMLVTLVTLLLAFSSARRALFNFQSVQEQNAQLSAQQKVLAQTVQSLESQAEAQAQELESASRELAAAVADRDEAQAEFRILQDQQAGLEADIDTLDVEVKHLRGDLATAQTDLDTAQARLAEAEAALKEAQAERERAEKDAEEARAEVEEAQAAVTELATRVTEAQSRLEVVQQELSLSQAELEAAQQQTNELQAQQEVLEEDNVKLLGLNKELDQINRDRLAQITAQNDQLRALNDKVSELTRLLEEQANALALAQTQAQLVNSRDVTYTVNQVVHTGIIDAQDAPGVRAQFAELVAAANDKAVQLRAGDVALAPEQSESVTQAVLQTPGADVVTLRSTQNQYVSEPLSVSVEVSENRKLVDGGQLVVTQQMHLGSPEFQEQRDSVRSDLSRLFISANSSLLAKGLADGVYPVTSETSLEIEGFTNQLLRLSGPVVVGLAASDDIYSGGPAKLEFLILN